MMWLFSSEYWQQIVACYCAFFRALFYNKTFLCVALLWRAWRQVHSCHMYVTSMLVSPLPLCCQPFPSCRNHGLQRLLWLYVVLAGIGNKLSRPNHVARHVTFVCHISHGAQKALFIGVQGSKNKSWPIKGVSSCTRFGCTPFGRLR